MAVLLVYLSYRIENIPEGTLRKKGAKKVPLGAVLDCLTFMKNSTNWA